MTETAEMQEAKILQCPFCGSDKIAIGYSDFGHDVRCFHYGDGCKAGTGTWPTRAEAIAAWNRRSGPSQSDFEAMRAQRDEAGALADRLKLEAQIHAGEARTANSTIYEIYRIVSGATGERGNWHGAQPVRTYVAALQAQITRLREALKPFADACISLDGASDRTGTPRFRDEYEPARGWTTLGQLRVARAALSEPSPSNRGDTP